jgi:hypothetical protein
MRIRVVCAVHGARSRAEDGCNNILLARYGSHQPTPTEFAPIVACAAHAPELRGWRRLTHSASDSRRISWRPAITGTSPGLVNLATQDFHLTAGSQAIDAGTILNPAVLPNNNVVREYVKHLSSVTRAVHGALDIGAYEFS